MIYAIILAFSTYTKIPMPYIDEEKAIKNYKWMITAFPLTGVFIGGVQALILYLNYLLRLKGLEVEPFLGALLTVTPIILTGGIHLDGYMDVIDAISSYKSMDERKRILKDPHIGAFAAIYLGVYILLSLGTYFSLLKYGGDDLFEVINKMIFVISLFYLERIISALLVCLMPKMSKEGMIHAATKGEKIALTDIRCVILVIQAFIALTLMSTNVFMGFSCLCIIACITFFFIRMAIKNFGGISGDLAGYYLQVAELFGIIIVTLVSLGMNL